MEQKSKSQAIPDEKALVEAVCGSAHQIWQAGLGAFAKAQEEGNEMFTRLVQEGTDLQKRTQHLVGEKGYGAVDTVTRLAENVGKRATDSWKELEKAFEERMARSIRNLGLPTQDDIKALGRKIDELNRIVGALGAKGTAAATAKKAATKQPAKAAAKPARKTAAVKAVKAAKGATTTAAKKRARASELRP